MNKKKLFFFICDFEIINDTISLARAFFDFVPKLCSVSFESIIVMLFSSEPKTLFDLLNELSMIQSAFLDFSF